MSKGKQQKFIQAEPASGLRKGRKVVKGISAAIIASAMMGGGAAAQTIWDTSFTTGSWDYGVPSSVTLRAGATISASSPGTTYIGATHFILEDGTINRVNLSDSANVGGQAYLEKTTNGRAVLLGVQSYSGNTLVYGGTLQLGQGGTDGAYDGQILSNAGIFVFEPGNLEVQYADGSSFDKDVRLIGDNATFTSWTSGANHINYIDGVITGHQSTGTMDVIDGGRFDKRGAGTTDIRGGVAITGDVDIWNGDLIVEGSIAASDVQTGLHGNSDASVRVDGGGIAANVHLRLGADLEIEDGGAVVGNITGGNAGDTAQTDINISDDSYLNGSINLYNGNVTLSNGTQLGGGNFLTGNITISNEGNLTVTDYGVVTGAVTIETGHVALTNHAGVAGNIRVFDGYVDLVGNSGVIGNVRVDVGGVNLDELSGITGNVTLNDGDLILDNGSAIAGTVEVDEGDITLSNASQISGNVHVGEGGISLSSLSSIVNGNVRIDDASNNGDSATWQALHVNNSGVHGNVSVGIGNVAVTNGHIGGDLTIEGFGNLSVTGVGDGITGNVDLADGDISLAAGGNIDGDADVTDHNIALNNGSEIGGDATARDGIISLNNGSSIGGDANVRDGSIVLNNGSTIGENVSLRDGAVFLDNDSRVDGNVLLGDGSVDIDNGSSVGGNVVNSGDGSVGLTNQSFIQGDLRILGEGNANLNDSGVFGNISVANGDAVVTDSTVGFIIGGNGNINVGFGNVLATDSSIFGNVNVYEGNVIVNHLSGLFSFIQGDVDVTTGKVGLNDSSIGGNVSIGEGNLELENDSHVEGNVIIGAGNATLNDSDVDGSLTITTGNLSAAADSDVDGDVTITTGNIGLNDSSIGGNASIGTGNLELLNDSHVEGNVVIGSGNATLNDSDVDGGVTITTGSLSATAGSDIDGNVAITTGNVTLSDSNVDGDVSIATGLATITNSDVDGRLTVNNVTGGDVTIDNSTVGTNDDDGIQIGSGNVNLVNDSFVFGDTSINNGNLSLSGDSDIFGDVSILSGNLSAIQDSDIIGDVLLSNGSLNLDLSSAIRGDATVSNGDVTLDNGSEIGDDLYSVNGSVSLDHGSEIGDTAYLENGNLTLNHDSSVGDLATVEVGNISLDNGSVLENGAYVQDGNITLAHNSEINRHFFNGEDVTVDHGAVSLSTESAINNDVYVLAGQVSAIEGSVINGDVSVTESRGGDTYAIGLNNSDINGDVSVGQGNIFLQDGSGIDGDVLVVQGDLALTTGSHIDSLPNGTVFVGLGNINLDTYSAINANVGVERGDVSLVLNSAINGDVNVALGSVTVDDNSGIDGDVSITNEGNLLVTNQSAVSGDVDVNKGYVNVFHESVINGDVHVAGSDLHPSAVIVEDESAINGSVTVGTGDILVNNFSSINGGVVTTDLGDIDILNDSNVTGHVIINDGHLFVSETSAINGLVDVNGNAAANIEGIVNGDVSLNDGGIGQLGGVLYGNPTITGNLINNGYLTPGFYTEPVGRALVGGDYIQGLGGTYRADIRADRTHDTVLVGGEAFLGGTLLITADPTYKAYRNDRFRLLRADGGREGRFDLVVDNFAKDTMLAFNVRYGSKSVWAEITQRKFAELKGLTHNQREVAKALDHAAVRNQIDGVFDHLNYTSISNVPGLLQLLSPEQLTSIFTISTASAQIQNVNIERRLDAVRAGRAGNFSSEGLALSNDRGTINIDGAPIANTADGLTLAGWDGKSIVTKEVVEPVVYQSRWSAFVTGHGEWASIKNTSEALGQDFRTAGVTVGADLRVSENFVLGLTGGYANTESDLAHDGDISVNSGRGSVYASYFGENAYVNAAAGGGYNSYKTKRATLGGFAQGDSEGGEFNALLGLGYDFHVGGLSIGPVASAQYTYTGLSSFTETGSDAPLHFESQSNDSLRSLVGLKVDYTINTGSVVIRPEVRAQWKHEYLDTAPSITSRFSGADKSFTVNGPDIGRDSLVLDAGAAVEFNNTWSVFAYYTGEIGRKNYDSHSINGGFRVSF